jgi:type II secretory pathway component GspD/PulD (secretin)
VAVLAVAMSGTVGWGQTAAATPKPAADAAGAKPSQPDALRIDCTATEFVEKVFYLTGVTQPNDGNEVLTAVRNVLFPCSKVFLVPSREAIIAYATADQVALAEKIIGQVDRPKKSFRLTYTITEMDGTKRVGSQSFAMVVADGQRTQMKEGSKVPLATGSYAASSTSTAQTQFTYVDVGMNFDVTATELGNGATLKTHVEQSSVADEKAIVGVQEPVIRQATLEGTSFVLPGKPLLLGSMDIPGSTRRLDVEVTMEVVQ